LTRVGKGNASTFTCPFQLLLQKRQSPGQGSDEYFEGFAEATRGLKKSPHRALQGLRPRPPRRNATAAGGRIRVLADGSFASVPVLLLVPSRTHQSTRLRALSTFLINAIKP
jgi:hypothetical protein